MAPVMGEQRPHNYNVDSDSDEEVPQMPELWRANLQDVAAELGVSLHKFDTDR